MRSRLQPFFNLSGQEAGLGLSLIYYMVVKGHEESAPVNSVESEGAEFIIQLPINSDV